MKWQNPEIYTIHGQTITAAKILLRHLTNMTFFSVCGTKITSVSALLIWLNEWESE